MNENHASGPATSESNIQATEEQMYRHNSSHYEARCSQHCMNQNCMENGTAVDGCVMYCCNSSMCLTVDAVINAVPDDMNNNTTMKASTPMMTTAMPTTTATTISYSDKKCRSFKCAGLDCFKTQTGAPTKQCRVGINHCELQKVVASGGSVSYEGGCSNTCSTSKNSCASITNANCFQECCNATNTGCCMKLDGQVHFNTAAHISRGSVLKIVSCAIIVIFTSRFFSSFRA
ncbi:uncharacterized protein WCC33_000856 [Rhinophrynus dorsalis]